MSRVLPGIGLDSPIWSGDSPSKAGTQTKTVVDSPQCIQHFRILNLLHNIPFGNQILERWAQCTLQQTMWWVAMKTTWQTSQKISFLHKDKIVLAYLFLPKISMKQKHDQRGQYQAYFYDPRLRWKIFHFEKNFPFCIKISNSLTKIFSAKIQKIARGKKHREKNLKKMQKTQKTWKKPTNFAKTEKQNKNFKKRICIPPLLVCIGDFYQFWAVSQQPQGPLCTALLRCDFGSRSHGPERGWGTKPRLCPNLEGRAKQPPIGGKIEGPRRGTMRNSEKSYTNPCATDKTFRPLVADCSLIGPPSHALVADSNYPGGVAWAVHWPDTTTDLHELDPMQINPKHVIQISICIKL